MTGSGAERLNDLRMGNRSALGFAFADDDPAILTLIDLLICTLRFVAGPVDLVDLAACAAELRRAGTTAPPVEDAATDSEHPGFDDLAAVVDRAGGSAVQPAVDAHLAACRRCPATIAELSAARDEVHAALAALAERRRRQPPSSWATRWRAWFRT